MTAKKDTWEFLKDWTHARIALGRAGHALPTKEVLRFKLAHSRARDSVWREVDFSNLKSTLKSLSLCYFEVQSQCTGKQHYLLNPDLGRVLSPESVTALKSLSTQNDLCDIVVVVADGLSADGIHSHGKTWVREFSRQAKAEGLCLGPVVLARYGRVALGDEIASRLKAKSVIVLIGERPGLGSSESLSSYFTYDPKVGRTDADRNCISNIHSAGLPPAAAAEMGVYLAKTAISRQLSGVGLKLEFGSTPLIQR